MTDTVKVSKTNWIKRLYNGRFASTETNTKKAFWDLLNSWHRAAISVVGSPFDLGILH